MLLTQRKLVITVDHLRKQFVIQPGEEVRFAFILGIGKDNGEKLRTKYQDLANVDAAFAGIKAHWDERCARLSEVTQ